MFDFIAVYQDKIEGVIKANSNSEINAEQTVIINIQTT